MTAAAILIIACVLKLNTALCEVPACHISSRSDDERLSYRDLSEFMMAAAAILVFLFVVPALCWADHPCCIAPACQISSSLDDIWPSYSGLSEVKMAA